MVLGEERGDGRGLAVADEGEAVTLLDSDLANVRQAQADGLHALHGDAIEPGQLDRAGIGWCQALVAASPSDKANLLICQTARGHGAGTRLIARVNDARNAPAFGESGIEALRALAPWHCSTYRADFLLSAPKWPAVQSRLKRKLENFRLLH